MKTQYISDRGTYYQVSVPYEKKGEKKFYTKTFSIKKYGKRKAFELAREERDRFILSKKKVYDDITLEELLNEVNDLFLCSKKTEIKRRNTYNKFIKEYNKPIKYIKSNDIQTCLNSHVLDCTNDTLSRIFSLWKLLFKTALIKDYIDIDMTAKVIMPKSKKITVKRKQTITQDEFNELLEMIETHCTNKYDCFLIVSALKIMRYTGMRPSEVYALTKDDIDFKNHTIRVNKAVGSNSSEKYAVITTKTALSNRLIPYPSKLQIVLERLPEGFMFKRENGQLLNGDFVSDKIRIYSKGKYRTYMLRHQFSTDLITNNTDIRTVARSNDELKKEAVNKID